MGWPPLPRILRRLPHPDGSPLDWASFDEIYARMRSYIDSDELTPHMMLVHLRQSEIQGAVRRTAPEYDVFVPLPAWTWSWLALQDASTPAKTAVRWVEIESAPAGRETMYYKRPWHAKAEVAFYGARRDLDRLYPPPGRSAMRTPAIEPAVTESNPPEQVPATEPVAVGDVEAEPIAIEPKSRKREWQIDRIRQAVSSLPNPLPDGRVVDEITDIREFQKLLEPEFKKRSWKFPSPESFTRFIARFHNRRFS